MAWWLLISPSRNLEVARILVDAQSDLNQPLGGDLTPVTSIWPILAGQVLISLDDSMSNQAKKIARLYIIIFNYGMVAFFLCEILTSVVE